MATIFDVAKASGVSAMTVSRVINAPDKVNKKTRDIVNAKIKELNYSPNVVAKSLVLKKTNIIYVYIPEDISATHPFFSQVVAGIGERLGEHDYSMLIGRKEYTIQSCDGIIAMGLNKEQEKRIGTLFKNKPYVVFGSQPKINYCVDVDNYSGVKLVINYLNEKGYKKIAYIGINQNKTFTFDRYNGFIDGMKENGLTIDESLITSVDNNEHFGYEACKSLLKTCVPEVVVCASDLLAIGACRAIKEEGLSIPTDIAVTGFDGLGFETLSIPHLTTVTQPVYEVGIRLAEEMIGRIDKKAEKSFHIKIMPKLVVHESTK